MAWESEKLQLSPAVVYEGVGAVLNQKQSGEYFLFLYEQKPIGCALLQYEWSDWRAKQFIWLHSVYIKPEFRRQGVFSLFFDFVKARVLHRPDLAGIRLYVAKANQNAESCYRNLGMQDEHYKLFEWEKT